MKINEQMRAVMSEWPVNRPLAIDQRLAPQMIHRLQNSNPSMENPLGFFFEDTEQKIAVVTGAEPNSVPDGIGVVKINGPLWHSGYWHDYADALAAIQHLNDDPAVQAIMLEINSPGGHVHGCFDVVDQIYALRGGKPIWAVANETACSAAYALASAADRIIAPRTADVGSIGVYMIHWDYSQMLADEGIKLTPIFAGDNKLDGHPDFPLAADARARIQSEISDLYELFVKTVARNRSVAVATVIDTKAEVLAGAQALSAGLIDQVASVSDAYQQLAAEISKNSNLPVPSLLAGLATKPTLLGATKEKQMSFKDALAVAQKKAASKEGMSDEEKLAGFDELVALADKEPEAEQVDVDKVTAEAKAEGQKQAKGRVAEILGCEEAKGREQQAQFIALETEMDVEAAKGLLGNSPKATGKDGLASALTETGDSIESEIELTEGKEANVARLRKAAQASGLQLVK